MSPPIKPGQAANKIAYMISKYGMTLLTHGLATEVAEHNIAVNSLWPVTIIESQASINAQLGGREMWRTPRILTDALLAIKQLRYMLAIRSRGNSCVQELERELEKLILLYAGSAWGSTERD